MINWEKSKSLFGTIEDDVNKKSKIWFVCDNCGKEYQMSYKTILERKRCKRDKCKFCANKTLTSPRSSGFYTKKSRDKTGRKILYQKWLNKKENNHSLFLKSLVYGSLNEDKRNKRIGDITYDFVLDLLKKQNFKCKLSGADVKFCKSLSSVSIDRINNDFGHTKQNVQLICRGLNIAKNRHTNDDITYLLDCLINKKSFIPKKFSRDYVSSVCRNSHQRDNFKGIKSDLTTDLILEMFENQNGLCAITGLPMACYKHPCFSISVDRINNDLGHVVGNVHLVLKSINIAKSKFTINQVKEWLEELKRCYARFN